MPSNSASSWRSQSGVRYTMASTTPDAAMPGEMTMAYASESRAADPYAGFEARIVPENVTLLPKTNDQVTGGNATSERVHVIRKGDTVGSVLVDQGATPEEARAIAKTLGPYGRDGGLREGALQALEHPVEGGGQTPDLVHRPLIHDALADVLGALDALDDRRDFGNGAQAAADDTGAEQRRDQ